MSFIYNFWNKTPEEPLNRPEKIINQLFTRLKTSSQLQDRRDSLKSLVTLVKEYIQLLTEEHVDTIIHVFLNDGDNTEMVCLCFRLLLDIMSQKKQDDIGVVCKKLIIYTPQVLSPLMNSLINADKNIRRYGLDILSLLASEFPSELPSLMFSKSSTIFSVLTELLEDNWDYIRFSSLNLLVLLSETDEEIKKLIAFENGFIRALNLIKMEGFSEGQVVDLAVKLIHNLVRSNSSNKTSFVEGNCLGILTCLLSSVDITNTACLENLFDVLDEIVSERNSRLNILKYQTKIAHSGLLKTVVDLTFRPDLPPLSFPRFVSTISKLIRGADYPQNVFENSFLPLSGRTPPTTLTVWIMDSEKSVNTRLALTNCLVSFLMDNERAKSAVIQTFLPQLAVKNNHPSPGKKLCSGILSSDSLSVFLSCVIISACLTGQSDLKADLLRVQLSPSPHLPPSLLIYHCAEIIMKELSLFVTGGMMSLLSTWVIDCRPAVQILLRMDKFMNFLIGHVCGEVGYPSTGISSLFLAFLLLYNDDSVPQYSRECILKFVERGCGSVGCFFDRIDVFCRSDVFLSSLTFSELQVSPDSLSLDPLFVRTVTKSYAKIDGLREPSQHENSEIDRLSKELKMLEEANEGLRTSLKSGQTEVDSLVAKVTTMGGQLEMMNADLGKWQTAYYAKCDEAVQLRECYECLKNEHDDLLVCMAEMEMRDL